MKASLFQVYQYQQTHHQVIIIIFSNKIKMGNSPKASISSDNFDFCSTFEESSLQFQEHINNSMKATLQKQKSSKSFIVCSKVGQKENEKENNQFDLQKFDQTLKSFQSVMETDPTLAQSVSQLARIFNDTGNTQDVEFCHKSIKIMINPRHAMTHYVIGSVLDKMGKTENAIKSYQKSIQIDPDNAFVHINLGALLQSVEKYSKSVKSYRRALKIDQKNIQAHYNMGNVLDKLGRTEQAIESYKKAIRINPNFLKAYINLGAALENTGRTELAIECYRKVIQINPKEFRAHYNLGNVLDKVGRSQEAIESFTQVLRINPRHALTHFNIGNAYDNLGNNYKAIESYRNSIKIDPKFADAYHNMAYCLSTIGNFEEALVNYQKAVELNPNIENSYENIQLLLRKKKCKKINSLKKSMKSLKTIIYKNPDNQRAKDTIAVLQNEIDTNQK